MIQIINENGQVLDLDSEYVLTLEQNSFLFNDTDAFASDVSYPGTAPLTASNKHFIKNGHLLERSITVYRLPVNLNVNGRWLSGDFIYSLKAGKIEFSIKINMGIVYERITSTKITEVQPLSEIRYLDQTPSQFIQLMEASCDLPELYPFVFCPIYNNKKSATEDKNLRPYLNAWNDSTNDFYIYSFAGMDITHETPFYKLRYVLQMIAEYFGLKTEGDFFTDAYYDDVYIYTNRTVEYLPDPGGQPGFVVRRSIGSFSKYMPDITVSEFLLQLRDRLHLPITVNSTKRTLRVDTGKGLLESTSVLDICNYVSEIREINVLTSEGLSVTLEPDPTDESYKFENPLTGDTLSFPEFELVVNEGDEDLGLPVATLKPHQAETPLPILQSINNVTDPVLSLEPVGEHGFAVARSNKINNWSLRLFKYTGRQTTTNLPMSEPLNLDQRDIQWYRFINDVKEILVIAYLPKYILAKLDINKKVAVRSQETYLVHGLIKKLEYGIGMRDSELIEVEMTIYVLNMDQNTIAQIKPVDPTEIDE